MLNTGIRRRVFPMKKILMISLILLSIYSPGSWVLAQSSPEHYLQASMSITQKTYSFYFGSESYFPLTDYTALFGLLRLRSQPEYTILLYGMGLEHQMLFEDGELRVSLKLSRVQCFYKQDRYPGLLFAGGISQVKPINDNIGVKTSLDIPLHLNLNNSSEELKRELSRTGVTMGVLVGF